jgi:hypothetical protein
MFFNSEIIIHITGELHVLTNTVLQKLLLKTAALLSVNTIPKHTLVYAPMCRCTFVVLADSFYVLCAAVICYLHMTRKRNHLALQTY